MKNVEEAKQSRNKIKLIELTAIYLCLCIRMSVAFTIVICNGISSFFTANLLQTQEKKQQQQQND